MNAQTQMHKRTQLIAQPFSEQSLGATLRAALSDQILSFHTFRAAVAFVKRSGVQYIQIELQQFVQSGGFAQIVVGIDQLGSSLEGLTGLLNAVGEQGSVWVNRTTETYVTFHPKVYLFVADRIALLIVGSGNLTEGGLYTNDEASLMYWLDLEKTDDQVLLQEINTYLDQWSDVDDGNAVLLTADLLNELVEMGWFLRKKKLYGKGTRQPPLHPHYPLNP